jgi:hypothetical protein
MDQKGGQYQRKAQGARRKALVLISVVTANMGAILERFAGAQSSPCSRFQKDEFTHRGFRRQEFADNFPTVGEITRSAAIATLATGIARKQNGERRTTPPGCANRTAEARG